MTAGKICQINICLQWLQLVYRRSGPGPNIVYKQYLHAVEYFNPEQQPEFPVQSAQRDHYARIYGSLGLVLVEVNRQRDFLLDPGLDLEQLIIPTKYLNTGIQRVCSSDKVCCLNNPWLYPSQPYITQMPQSKFVCLGSDLSGRSLH
ncbi:hypothetical protein TWF718_006651 [Orbilia javanica]|uniref:Uncharacterized protein n=1 Tax=Orbilia javanica TaxID=47235 RepID=A0AAN8NUN9_9PEZI